MANHCYTIYKITGSQKAVKNLWDTLVSMDVNKKEVWLADLAKHYGIDHEKRQIAVRGDIFFAEYDSDENLLTLKTMTAWLGCHKFFWALNEVLGDEMSISYLEKEISAGVFCIHDEGEFFTAKCCVYSFGDPFDGFYYDDFNSIEDAIQEWCSKMGVERGDKSEEEMIDYINGYEYDEMGSYFEIQKYIIDQQSQ